MHEQQPQPEAGTSPSSSEYSEVLAAVGAALVTAQALELSLVALILILDQRHDVGAPLEDMAERYQTLRDDPLGNLITKLGQVGGATAEDLRALRNLKAARDEFVHNYCVRPSFLSRVTTEQGRQELLGELRRLDAQFDAARREASRLAIRVAERRFDLKPAELLEHLRELVAGEHDSRVLEEDVVDYLRRPQTLKAAEAILQELIGAVGLREEHP